MNSALNTERLQVVNLKGRLWAFQGRKRMFELFSFYSHRF